METIKFTELEKKYKNFYVPAFELFIEEENVLTKGIEVANIRFSDALNAAADFSFTVNNAFDPIKKDFQWMDEFFSPGKKVKIKMGYTDNLQLMILGQISSVDVNFPSEGLPQLNIRGKDAMDLMMKDSKPMTWKNSTHSEVVEKIITKKYSSIFDLDSMAIEDTKVKYNIVSQQEKSDFKFIDELSEKDNFEFFLQDKTFYFRERPKDSPPITSLEWGKSLVSFSAGVNMSNQVGSVKITGWNPDKKEVFTATAPEGSTGDVKAKTGAQLVQEIYGDCSVAYKRIPVVSQEDADLKAKALHDKNADKLVTGSGESIGLPEIRAGRYIRLEGLGKKFSKSYYIISSEHSISSSGYSTIFKVEVDKI